MKTCSLVQFIYFYSCCHKYPTDLVTLDLLVSVAHQGGCCFISVPVVFVDFEVRRVHAAILARRLRRVVLMDAPPAVVIAVRDLIGRNKLYIILEAKRESEFLLVCFFMLVLK